MIPVGTKVSYLVSSTRKWGRVLVYHDPSLVLVSQDGAPTTQRVMAEAALTAPSPPPDPPPGDPAPVAGQGYKQVWRDDFANGGWGDGDADASSPDEFVAEFEYVSVWQK